jgi:uncharacterized membrane protein
VTAEASSGSAPAAQRRLLFLDGLRGIALILMVVNHTSRWWLDVKPLGWPRYYLIYGSVILPASIFLFLVGFCLPLSYRRSPGRDRMTATLLKYGRRGLQVIAAGLLLNLVVFPEEPIWTGGVLQTIGLSIVVLGPLLPLLRSRWGREGLLALAVGLFVAFTLSYQALQQWVVAHPVMGRIWFFDFPPWPWLSAALIGLVLGWRWLDARERGRAAEARYFATTALVGVVCLLFYLAWEWWLPTAPRFGFPRDFLLNRHWTPRGVTTALIAGGLACLLAGTYWLMEVKGWQLRWLVVLGQTALMLYFVHQLIVLTLINQALGLRFNNWPLYVGANLALIVLLVGMGYAWLAIKRAWRGHGLGPASVWRTFGARRGAAVK